jgi:hypothetical protein
VNGKGCLQGRRAVATDAVSEIGAATAMALESPGAEVDDDAAQSLRGIDIPIIRLASFACRSGEIINIPTLAGREGEPKQSYATGS